MHKLNVLAFGSKNFNTSLEELKDYLNFNLVTVNNLEDKSFDDYEVLFVHIDYFRDNLNKKNLEEIKDKIKILVCNDIVDPNYSNIFIDKIVLPTSVKDINLIIENSTIKKSFNKNSSIQIKQYNLDKNQKKLLRDNNYVLLTEKEIQLLELFLIKNQSIGKKKILNEVWKYAADADTHTVETHIYRLRKKIKNKFNDENFILNDKSGYSL